MTKEKLEKEAEKWVNTEYDNSYFPDCNYSARMDAIEAYIAGAEPREKRIAELEKENAELKADNDARKFAMAMSEKVEKQLREENAELRDKLIKKIFLLEESPSRKTVSQVRGGEHETEEFDFKAFLDAGRRAAESNY